MNFEKREGLLFLCKLYGGERTAVCVYGFPSPSVEGAISCFETATGGFFVSFVFVLYGLSSNHSLLSAKFGPLPYRDPSSTGFKKFFVLFVFFPIS